MMQKFNKSHKLIIAQLIRTFLNINIFVFMAPCIGIAVNYFHQLENELETWQFFVTQPFLIEFSVINSWSLK